MPERAPLYLPHANGTRLDKRRAEGKSMVAMLYASHGGTLVLVPECFEPASGLVRAHGRFRRCGRIQIADRSVPELCGRISADFDQNSYCVLDSRDAIALFGPQIPRISGDRRLQQREVELVCRQQEAGSLGSPVLEPEAPRRGKWSPAALRAWLATKAIAARTGMPMREFVRFNRMPASPSAAGNLPPAGYPRNAADCTISRGL